jgi:septal ring factor EnvC (AmiA/AmiB activator)
MIAVTDRQAEHGRGEWDSRGWRYTDSDTALLAGAPSAAWGPKVEQLEQLEHQQDEHQETRTPSASLTVSTDDFAALEERIVRTVETVKRERQTRIAAEERAVQAEAHASELTPRIEQLEKELHSLKWEREQVRQRVERLLAQLDVLEL